MDQFMVDASACPSAALDAEVVFIGRSGGAEISADEVASLEGTINYEVVTRLLDRLPRVYVSG
jgi:alanine racemase